MPHAYSAPAMRTTADACGLNGWYGVGCSWLFDLSAHSARVAAMAC
jgi:hypothetical protein